MFPKRRHTPGCTVPYDGRVMVDVCLQMALGGAYSCQSDIENVSSQASTSMFKRRPPPVQTADW